MGVSAEQLLGILGSTVRGYAPETGHDGARGTDSPFLDLLASARAGEVTTGLPVAIEPGAASALATDLTEDEIAALSAIADRAAAQGARTVAVVRGDEVLTLDTQSRRVTGVHGLGEQPVPGAETVARLPERYEHALGLPGTLLSLTPESFDAGLGSVNVNASLRGLLGTAGS